MAHELAGNDRCWRERVLQKALDLAGPVPQDPADLVWESGASYKTPAHAAAPKPWPASPAAKAVLVTSAETLQEVPHRYRGNCPSITMNLCGSIPLTL